MAKTKEKEFVMVSFDNMLREHAEALVCALMPTGKEVIVRKTNSYRAPNDRYSVIVKTETVADNFLSCVK